MLHLTPPPLPGFQIDYNGKTIDALALGTLHTHLHLIVDHVAHQMLVQQGMCRRRSRKTSANAFAYPQPGVRLVVDEVKIGSLLETLCLVVSPLLASSTVTDVLRDLASNVIWEILRCGVRGVRGASHLDIANVKVRKPRRSPTAALVREIMQSFEGSQGPRPTRLTIRSQADSSHEVAIEFGDWLKPQTTGEDWASS